MKTRFMQGLAIVALVVPFSSCPGIPQVTLGVWIFEVKFDVTTTSRAIELMDNGFGLNPDPLPSGTTVFDGIKFWKQDGATFVLEQSVATLFEYTGTVDSPTSIINGTWEEFGGDSGTWTATKL
jgi:hypothetical protein